MIGGRAAARQGVRLQQLLSAAGVASRRTAEQLIADGRVTVNGQTVREPGTRADPAADDVRVEFNRRLKKEGLPAGRWKTGGNPLARLLGKELTLLAWAVEDADPALVPAAVRNWLGLAPEERWWLFTMTAAATGHAVHGRGRGWRKAVRYALSENPVSAADAGRGAAAETFRLMAPEARRTQAPGCRRGSSARRGAASAGKGGH